MSTCATNEVEEPLNVGDITGIGIVTVIILGFIITYLVFRFQGKKPKTMTGEVYKSFDRLGGFFSSTQGHLSIAMLVAILVSDVIGAFNGMIITPVVRVAIPKKEDGTTIFDTPVEIGRDVKFAPGHFVLSLIGFIISMLILFFIIEGFYQLSRLPKTRKVLKYLFMTLVIGLLVGLLIWNIWDVSTPKCKDKVAAASALGPERQPTTIVTNPMMGSTVFI